MFFQESYGNGSYRCNHFGHVPISCPDAIIEYPAILQANDIAKRQIEKWIEMGIKLIDKRAHENHFMDFSVNTLTCKCV